jgi:hypothetical protein
MSRNRSGQSVLEYVIVLSAIIAIIILASTTLIPKAVNQNMTDASNSLTKATGTLP